MVLWAFHWTLPTVCEILTNWTFKPKSLLLYRNFGTALSACMIPASEFQCVELWASLLLEQSYTLHKKLELLAKVECWTDRSVGQSVFFFSSFFFFSRFRSSSHRTENEVRSSNGNTSSPLITPSSLATYQQSWVATSINSGVRRDIRNQCQLFLHHQLSEVS